jgi:hypothetical protein
VLVRGAHRPAIALLESLEVTTSYAPLSEWIQASATKWSLATCLFHVKPNERNRPLAKWLSEERGARSELPPTGIDKPHDAPVLPAPGDGNLVARMDENVIALERRRASSPHNPLAAAARKLDVEIIGAPCATNEGLGFHGPLCHVRGRRMPFAIPSSTTSERLRDAGRSFVVGATTESGAPSAAWRRAVSSFR